MIFALHDFMAGAIDRMVMVSRDNHGNYTSKRLTFLPNTHYETVDPVFIDYIKGNIGDVREKMLSTADLKAELDSRGIKYEITKCGSCPSAKPKVIFNPFKIIEE